MTSFTIWSSSLFYIHDGSTSGLNVLAINLNIVIYSLSIIMWNNYRKPHFEISPQSFKDSRDIRMKVIQYLGMYLLVWKL